MLFGDNSLSIVDGYQVMWRMTVQNMCLSVVASLLQIVILFLGLEWLFQIFVIGLPYLN